MVVFVDQLTIAERDNLHFNMAVGIAHCVSFFRLDKRKESWNLREGTWKRCMEEGKRRKVIVVTDWAAPSFYY